MSIPPSWFVDGGVLMNTPLSPAIRAGATELHVVYLDPEIRRIPLGERQTTLGTLQRTLAIGMAGIMRRDIEAAQRINRGLELLHGGAGALAEADGRSAAGDRAGGVAHPQRRAYELLTIHRYHPRELLGGPLGLLRFEPGFTRMLIERGYRDVMNHDCEEAGCVVPGRGATAAATEGRMAHVG